MVLHTQRSAHSSNTQHTQEEGRAQANSEDTDDRDRIRVATCAMNNSHSLARLFSSSFLLLFLGNELFCEVEAEFAQDSFNLTGLQNLIPYFDYALDMILDVEPTEILSDDQQEMIENDAENLYGLIHSRYILTTRGLQAMLDKYRLFHFGRCPRIYCRGQACLPIGISDVPNEEAVKLYCPKVKHTAHGDSTHIHKI